MKELFELQQRLVATKTNWNEFSNFSYRSLEDILQKAKPLLNELKCVITLTDDMVMLGDRFYIKSTATLQNENGEKESAIGWAREPLEIKGMSAPQVTGTASSYARKYALASLLAIDDNKDIDSLDDTPKQAKTPQKDDLAWTDEPPTTGNFVGFTKTPIQEFNEWYETAEKTPQVQKFYAYWKSRVENWRGNFNLSQLIEKYCN